VQLVPAAVQPAAVAVPQPLLVVAVRNRS